MKNCLGLFLALPFLFLTACALAEDLTITTYYPSPYGSYNELSVASTLVLGTDSNDPAVEFDDSRDLFIRSRVNATTVNEMLFIDGTSGNIGIGTTTPSSRLTVAGTVKTTGQANYRTVLKTHLQLHHNGCDAAAIIFSGNQVLECNCACSRHCQNLTPVTGDVANDPDLGYSGGTIVDWGEIGTPHVNNAGCVCIP